MANVQINQLPSSQPITGSELVPIVQNGVTVQTTTGAIAASPVLNYPFLTVGLQTALPSSRYFSTDTNLTITDGGAQGAYRISVNGALAQFNPLSSGFVVKTGTSTLANRNIAVSGSGIAISNGDGVSGNPTISLSGLPSALATSTGSGLLALNASTSLTPVTLTGTSNQIAVAFGDAQGGNPTISIASNAVFPGTGGVQIPSGTTAQRIATNGVIRYNTDTSLFEAYEGNTWVTLVSNVLSFSGGTTGLSPTSPTTGNIVLAGVLNASNGGTGVAGTLTGVLYGNGTSPHTVATGAQISSGLGSTYVANANFATTSSTASVATTATNLANGTSFQVPYQVSSGTTSFINAPTVAGTYLTYTGTGLAWAAAGVSVASITVGSTSVLLGVSGRLLYNNGGILGELATVGISQGGTGQSTASAAFNALSPITSTGDLIIGNGTNSATRLAIGTNNQVLTSNGTTASWVTPTNTGTVTSVAALTLGTTGTDLSSSVANSTTTPVITLNVPTASATNRGALSSTDWSTFNGKQAALVSGTNIKTVGGVSLLGAGDVGVIGGTYGGTGVNNGASTITVAGNLSHAGAFTQTFTATANTALTLPTSGTLISTVTNMAANPVTGTPSATNFLRGDGTWATPAGAGTVTLVSFTGGLISVATPTTTPALTVAGTSGGIVYFSSASTWASSAVLTASALMVGGGAGVAPSTITTGTGVVTALGNTTNTANGITVRDANNNILVNSVNEGFTSVAASVSLITLTAASTPNYLVTGSGGQTIKLPDATTLANGETYTFNNNQSSGTIIVQNNSSTTVVTIQSGSFSTVTLLNNSTAAGTWDWHNAAPSNASWSTNTLSWVGAITGLTSLSTTGQLTSTVATGTAPLVVSSTTQVANLNAATAGTATNVTLSTGAGATNYIPFSTTATGSSALTTNSLLTYNYTNNTLTAGISGGAF